MIEFDKLNKILFLPTLARSIRQYRIESYVKYMRQDTDCTIAVYTNYEVPEDYDSWELQIDVPEVFQELEDLVSKADMIITQAIHTQKAIAFLYAVKHKYGIPIYAEFDDDPYSLSAQHPHFKNLAPGSVSELWADDLVQFVDGIFVSTEYLKDRFKGKCSNVHVIPNGIDFDIWDNLKPKKRRKGQEDIINIGWVGGGNHSEDLELIERPIKHILNKHKNVRFIMAIGNEVPFYFRIKGVKAYDFRHWKPINEYPQFMNDLNIDIGIAPLRDRLHNRSKSNLKWLEFSALKVPLVASPVDPYLKTNALMAHTEDEWIEHLELLIKSEKKRKILGAESYNIVKADFNVETISKNYLDILKSKICLTV